MENNWREECGMRSWDDAPDDSCAIFGECNESECDYDNGDLLDYYEKKFHEHREEIKKLKERIDQLNVQLAGCGVAAIGFSDYASHGDYGWSSSYQDVVNLRLKYEDLSKQHIEEKGK